MARLIIGWVNQGLLRGCHNNASALYTYFKLKDNWVYVRR